MYRTIFFVINDDAVDISFTFILSYFLFFSLYLYYIIFIIIISLDVLLPLFFF